MAQAPVKPVVRVRRGADGYAIEAEMPGVAKDGVEVTFEDGKLTLVGRRRTAENAAKAIYRESSRADFRRVFDLDQSVDASRITAAVDQGVLTVTLPRSEASKPRQIAVA